MTPISRENEIEKVTGVSEKNETETPAFSAGAGAESSGTIVVKAGVTLHPQPTADPLDPLNWPWLKKHTILAIVMYL